jgi:hypothetical protein
MAAKIHPLTPNTTENPAHLQTLGFTAHRMDGTWTWAVYNGAHVIQGYVYFDQATGEFQLRTDWADDGTAAGKLMTTGNQVGALLKWLHIMTDTANT